MAGRCTKVSTGDESYEMATDREEWASVIKEGKTLRGPQSKGVSK